QIPGRTALRRNAGICADCSQKSRRGTQKTGDRYTKRLSHATPPVRTASYTGIRGRRRTNLLQNPLIFMKRRFHLAAAVFSILPLSAAPNSGINQVTGLRAFSHPGSTRVIIETT